MTYLSGNNLLQILHKGRRVIVALIFMVISYAPFAWSQTIAGSKSPELVGLKIHPQNPLRLDFIMDRGNLALSDSALKAQTETLVKYFLAALTLPDQEVWVNLSPTEKDRIIPEFLSHTQMGKVMLQQDYQLKELAASLTRPDTNLGKKYWNMIAKTSDKDVNYNSSKVWIMPDVAQVVEKDGMAYIDAHRLKVMIKEQSLTSANIFRQEIVPAIEQAVDESPEFTSVRQVYQAVILAAWYKRALKETLLGRVYADQSIIAGIANDQPHLKEKIYEQYLAAFKKGTYELIEEQEDPVTGDLTPRKYFSGGVEFFGKAASSSLIARAARPGEIENKLISQYKTAVSVVVRLDEYPGGVASSLVTQEDEGRQVIDAKDYFQAKTLANKLIKFLQNRTVANIRHWEADELGDGTEILTRIFLERYRMVGKDFKPDVPLSLSYKTARDIIMFLQEKHGARWDSGISKEHIQLYESSADLSIRILLPKFNDLLDDLGFEKFLVDFRVDQTPPESQMRPGIWREWLTEASLIRAATPVSHLVDVRAALVINRAADQLLEKLIKKVMDKNWWTVPNNKKLGQEVLRALFSEFLKRQNQGDLFARTVTRTIPYDMAQAVMLDLAKRGKWGSLLTPEQIAFVDTPGYVDKLVLDEFNGVLQHLGFPRAVSDEQEAAGRLRTKITLDVWGELVMALWEFEDDQNRPYQINEANKYSEFANQPFLANGNIYKILKLLIPEIEQTLEGQWGREGVMSPELADLVYEQFKRNKFLTEQFISSQSILEITRKILEFLGFKGLADGRYVYSGSAQDFKQSLMTREIIISSSAINSTTTKLISENPVGGIDFNANNLNLQIRRDGQGIPLPLPEQNLEQIHLHGLTPVILNITPLAPQLLSSITKNPHNYN